MGTLVLFVLSVEDFDSSVDICPSKSWTSLSSKCFPPSVDVRESADSEHRAYKEKDEIEIERLYGNKEEFLYELEVSLLMKRYRRIASGSPYRRHPWGSSELYNKGFRSPSLAQDQGKKEGWLLKRLFQGIYPNQGEWEELHFNFQLYAMYGSRLTRESLSPASSSVPGCLSLGPAASFRSKSRMIRKLQPARKGTSLLVSQSRCQTSKARARWVDMGSCELLVISRRGALKPFQEGKGPSTTKSYLSDVATAQSTPAESWYSRDGNYVKKVELGMNKNRDPRRAILTDEQHQLNRQTQRRRQRRANMNHRLLYGIIPKYLRRSGHFNCEAPQTVERVLVQFAPSSASESKFRAGQLEVEGDFQAINRHSWKAMRSSLSLWINRDVGRSEPSLSPETSMFSEEQPTCECEFEVEGGERSEQKRRAKRTKEVESARRCQEAFSSVAGFGGPKLTWLRQKASSLEARLARRPSRICGSRSHALIPTGARSRPAALPKPIIISVPRPHCWKGSASKPYVELPPHTAPLGMEVGPAQACAVKVVVHERAGMELWPWD
ncbi:hypothetical protein TSUD_335350 [Trifolium subterraneum]|uniref:Uncharacterized protein n=1 Tax=Trifolium subterraneum TaxID=3900 RepID=A0A2Z6LMI1_TRISU|nr:hypothetical protein TSUD_335350 [Trifolium subterraneum]